jgi:hypothetical protein
MKHPVAIITHAGKDKTPDGRNNSRFAWVFLSLHRIDPLVSIYQCLQPFTNEYWHNKQHIYLSQITNYMKYLFLIFTLALLSCGQDETKQKELALKEREIALKEKELALREKDSSHLIPTAQEVKKNDTVPVIKKPLTDEKTMTMTFEEYSEGDYPHLIFKDIATKKEYDFRFLSDNNLNGVAILLNDNNAAFGLKANPKYLKKTFIIETKKKTVSDADLDGKPIKSKEWVITSIKATAS